MIKGNSLIKNSASSIVQLLLTTIVMMVLYRIVYKDLGSDSLGILSLVLSLNAFINLASAGLPGGIIKYVAKYNALKEYRKLKDIIETSFISMIFLLIVSVSIGYPIFKLYLKKIVDIEMYGLSLDLLKITVATLVITMVYTIYKSIFDGLKMIFERNLITIITKILGFILSLMLIKFYGIIGFALGKLFEALVLLIISILYIKIKIPFLPIVFLRWKKEIFKEIFSYSYKIQLISVASMFFDPLTKGLISYFGGLGMVGIYEMSSKLVVQFRAFILTAFQSIVPHIASYSEGTKGKIEELYKKTLGLLLSLVIPGFTFLILLSPIISSLWLGELNTMYIKFTFILGISWMINSINIPAYFSNIGTGELNWNLVSNILCSILNASIGVIAGFSIGGDWIVLAPSISLIISSHLVTYNYHKVKDISFKRLLDKNLNLITVCSLIFTLVYLVSKKNNIIQSSIITSFYLVLMLLLMLKNKYIKLVLNKIGARR